MGQRHGLIRANTAIVVVRNINNKHRGCQPIETSRPTIYPLRNINTFYCTFERRILVLAKKLIRVTYFPPEQVQNYTCFVQISFLCTLSFHCRTLYENIRRICVHYAPKERGWWQSSPPHSQKLSKLLQKHNCAQEKNYFGIYFIHFWDLAPPYQQFGSQPLKPLTY